MTSKFVQFLLVLVLSVTLTPGTYAQGGHDNGHGGGGDKQDDKKQKGNDQGNDQDRENGQGEHNNGQHNNGAHNDRDDRDSNAARDHARDGNQDRDGDEKRPAGWDKGKKNGWGDCDVPPGQVKKLGCHPNSKHHVAHRDKDRDHDRNRHTATNRSRRTTVGGAGKTTTTGGAGKTTTTAKATTTRRTGGGKVFNDDGTWHYEGPGQPTTPAKK